MEKIFRDFCGQIQDFPVYWHTADQEWTGKEDWADGHRGWMFGHGCLLGCNSSYHRNNYL